MKDWIAAITIIACCAILFWTMGQLMSVDEACSEEEEKSAKKKMKTGTTICIIGIALFLIVPSSETVMKMVIAKNVTYDAVDAAKDVVVQVYNDILALFQK